MSTEPAEMKLVPTDRGWATALEPSMTNLGWLFGPALSVIALSFLVLLAGTLMAPSVLLLLGVDMLLIVLWSLIVPTVCQVRVETTAHGVRVSDLVTRFGAGPEQVRENVPSKLSWSPPGGRDSFFPFDTVRDLGHTDYSLWFDLGDRREEILLPKTRREDIQRLSEEIRVLWRRFQDGLQTTECEAAVQRGRLGAMNRE